MIGQTVTVSTRAVAAPAPVDDELPSILRCAAAEVIVEKGLGSFSIREVARRAGVSHAAPGYHFGDASGLLTSLAAEGLTHLHASTAAAAAEHDDPIDRLTAIGRAYVAIAERYPAHCEVIFRDDLIDPTDPVVEEEGLGAISVLADAIEAIAAEHNPDLAVDDAVKLCWSAMQGLVQINPKLVRLDDTFGLPESSTHDLVERFTELIVNGLIRR